MDFWLKATSDKHFIAVNVNEKDMFVELYPKALYDKAEKFINDFDNYVIIRNYFWNLADKKFNKRDINTIPFELRDYGLKIKKIDDHRISQKREITFSDDNGITFHVEYSQGNKRPYFNGSEKPNTNIIEKEYAILDTRLEVEQLPQKNYIIPHTESTDSNPNTIKEQDYARQDTDNTKETTNTATTNEPEGIIGDNQAGSERGATHAMVTEEAQHEARGFGKGSDVSSQNNGLQSQEMVSQQPKEYDTSRDIRGTDSGSSIDTHSPNENSRNQQRHHARERLEEGATHGRSKRGDDNIPQSRDRLHRHVSLSKKSEDTQSTKPIHNTESDLSKERYKQTLKEIEEQEQYYHKLDYKPSIKPILDNLQKEFKNNDYAILNWKERNSVGKMVVKKANFRSYENVKNTLQVYEDYAKAGNDVSKEIEAIQKALKDIEAQYTKKEQVRQEAQQALDELKKQKRALRLRYYKANIFTQYPHQTLAIQSKENQRSEAELFKHIKESNYLESITQAKEVVEQIRKDIQRDFNITPIAEFGTNYAENYRDGANAIAKVLRERQGQVAGAFYREELGDITLVWGVEGSGKSDGWGLAKIAKYHPEVLENLDELVEKLPIVKETANRYQLENEYYKASIRKDFEGQKENWVLTAFEKKDSIARRSTDLPNTETATEKTTSVNANPNSTTKEPTTHTMNRAKVL